MRKVYLGESVYADHDGHHIWLSTDNGFGDTNRIALDSEVFDALLKYAQRMKPNQEFQTIQPAVVRSEAAEGNS